MPRRGTGVIRPRATCYRCFKPEVSCICGSIAKVENRTGIVILQHPRERFHPVGTARIAELGLAKVRVESCAPWVGRSDVAASLSSGTALLYPSAAARELSTLSVEEQPRHLVVIDGTWFHAKKIYDAYPWLQVLPHVSLTPSEPSSYRIRRQPREGYVATLEAIVCALRILEPQTVGLDRLLDAFAAMIARQAAYVPARGREHARGAYVAGAISVSL